MNAKTNTKRGFDTARARWNVAAHALNRPMKFMRHSNPVRAGRTLTQCDFERQGQRQPRGGGCYVSLQPGFLGTADRE
jgi:hypothetical protein